MNDFTPQEFRQRIENQLWHDCGIPPAIRDSIDRALPVPEANDGISDATLAEEKENFLTEMYDELERNHSQIDYERELEEQFLREQDRNPDFD